MWNENDLETETKTQWWANHKSNKITMLTKWQQFQTLLSMREMSSMYIWPVSDSAKIRDGTITEIDSLTQLQ